MSRLWNSRAVEDVESVGDARALEDRAVTGGNRYDLRSPFPLTRPYCRGNIPRIIKRTYM